MEIKQDSSRLEQELISNIYGNCNRLGLVSRSVTLPSGLYKEGQGTCGGINPYTLTARLGPGGLAHYETSSRLDPTAWSFAQGDKMWRSSSILVG